MLETPKTPDGKTETTDKKPEGKLLKSACKVVRENFKAAFMKLDEFHQAVFYARLLQGELNVQDWVASEVRKFPKLSA